MPDWEQFDWSKEYYWDVVVSGRGCSEVFDIKENGYVNMEPIYKTPREGLEKWDTIIKVLKLALRYSTEERLRVWDKVNKEENS